MDTAEPPIRPVVPTALVEAADPNDNVIAYFWIQLLVRQRVERFELSENYSEFSESIPLKQHNRRLQEANP